MLCILVYVYRYPAAKRIVDSDNSIDAHSKTFANVIHLKMETGDVEQI